MINKHINTKRHRWWISNNEIFLSPTVSSCFKQNISSHGNSFVTFTVEEEDKKKMLLFFIFLKSQRGVFIYMASFQQSETAQASLFCAQITPMGISVANVVIAFCFISFKQHYRTHYQSTRWHPNISFKTVFPKKYVQQHEHFQLHNETQWLWKYFTVRWNKYSQQYLKEIKHRTNKKHIRTSHDCCIFFRQNEEVRIVINFILRYFFCSSPSGSLLSLSHSNIQNEYFLLNHFKMSEWLSIFKINTLRYESQTTPFLSDKKNRQYYSTEKKCNGKDSINFNLWSWEWCCILSDATEYLIEMSHNIVLMKQCITSLVHTEKVTKQIVAPVILGKPPNCFNKLLLE